MYQPILKPQPLGKVTVVTPGAPVALTSALVTAGVMASGDPAFVNKVNVIALPGNTGNVYVGAATMNKTTLAGVLAVITPGDDWQATNNMGVNKYPAHKYFVDADNANEGVYGSLDQE